MTAGSQIIAQLWISLDGFASGPSDEMAIMEVVDASADERSQQHNLALIDEVDDVLLGRRTYQKFAEYWPTAADTIAPAINSVPKVVITRTLDTAPWGDHESAQVESDLLDLVSELRAAGRRALIWGSLELIADLIESDQIDELDLFVAPVILGTGVSLLPAHLTVRLDQLESESWNSVTHIRYAVKR